MKLLKRLWNDEAGFVVSSELVLIATLLVIGLVVGLTSLRNQVVQELADTGAAIGMISQGFQYTGVKKTNVADTDGSGWDDRLDMCQTSNGQDAVNAEPAGISIDGEWDLNVNATPGEE